MTKLSMNEQSLLFKILAKTHIPKKDLFSTIMNCGTSFCVFVHMSEKSVNVCIIERERERGKISSSAKCDKIWCVMQRSRSKRRRRNDKFHIWLNWSVSTTIILVNDVENKANTAAALVCVHVWKGERKRTSKEKGYENIKLSLKAYLSKQYMGDVRLMVRGHKRWRNNFKGTLERL